MGTSAITVAALAAIPGVGYIDLAWTYSDPLNGALPNIALDAVEVWAATSNNRTLAAKVIEGITSGRHSGVSNGATWFYWIRARNKIGSYGDWHPSSATAGVSGTEATATQVTLSALTAVANVSQVSLQWVITDPSSTGLGYLGLAAVEVWAASTNDRAGAAKVTEGLTSAVHDAVPEGETRYYWVRPRNRNGTFGSFFPASTTAGVASTARDQVGLAYGLSNGKIVVAHNSPSSNQLTIAIKTLAGNDPSASDPVFLAFPATSATDGTYQIRQITAALALTVTSGSTLGVNANNKPFRLWFVIFDDGGTLRIGVNWCSDGQAIIVLSDGARASSTAEGGAGGADTQGFYTGTAVSSKHYRIIGYADWSSGLATTGAWGTAPDIVRMVGAGLKAPGQLLYEVSGVFQWTPSATFTALIPWDNTIPQISEGTAVLSAAILTPQSTINIIEVELMMNVSHSVASVVIMSLFKDGAINAIAAAAEYVAAADAVIQLHIRARVQALSVSAVSFEVRVGAVNAGTTTINGVAGGAKLSTTYISTYAFRELAG